MKFSYSFVEDLKVVKRTVTVFIAGIAISMALNAAPVNMESLPMSCPDPIEQVIADAEPGCNVPAIDYEELNKIGQRIEMLDRSLKMHGYEYMDESARSLWTGIERKAAEIPFKAVHAQYGKNSESLFISYTFASGHRLDATTYTDKEDDSVYFSVFSQGELILQNSMSRDIFFKKAKSTWNEIVNGEIS